MTRTGADTTALERLARSAGPDLAMIRRSSAATADALIRVRQHSDPHRVPLDPGLLAEVDALADAWRATDRHLLETAAALERGDLLGALALAMGTAWAALSAGASTTDRHLLLELRPLRDDPALVARWFAGLSPDEVTLLEAAGPAIGHLDGVPPAVRDRVNRRRVRAEVDRLRADVDDDGWHERNLGMPLVDDGWRDHHQATLARLASLEDLLTADQILLFDPAGDGRAVAAWGDVTAADHVATVVPGISNHLGNLTDTLRNARNVHVTANDQRSGSVATIAWLGYDTPGSLGNHTVELATEATHGGRARTAATDLGSFLHGLAATRRDGPAHVSVIGHSYGSRVLGETLSLGTVEVHEAVAVGSPGMGVDSVGEWDLPHATTVWAESAGSPDADWLLPGGGDDPIAHVPGHGRNPDDPAFGARGFDVTGASGHSAYFAVDPGTERATTSLTSLAQIVVGRTPAPDTDHVQFAPGDPDLTLAAS